MRQIKQRKVLKYINSDKMLRTAFRYYLEYNTGCNNPYHNVNHTMAMIDLLMDMEEGMLDTAKKKDDLNTMVLAAIFHDMNHSAGRLDDSHNVENAINAYLAFCEIYTAYFNEEVVRIIKATEFPYIEGVRLNNMQRKVRECDNLVCFYDDFLTQVLLGLKEEMHVTDLKVMIENERKFFRNSWKNLELPFSKQLVDKYKDEVESYLKDIEKLIS